MAARSKSNVIAFTRVYDAPLQAVWEAWTIPEEIAQWWGPRGFTLTTHERDLRTGGHWHYTMHGPDGTDYENTTQYLDVLPMQRLVYDHGGHRDRPPLFRVTALFTERDGRTRLDMAMAFATPEVAREMGGFIRQAGGESTWDRLAEYLGKRHSSQELFVIARSFQADIQTVYDMWTSPEHLAAMRKALEAHTRGQRPTVELIEQRLGPVSVLAKGIDTAADGAARRERRRG